MSTYLRHKIDETRVRLEAAQQEVAALKGQLSAYKDALAHDERANSTKQAVPEIQAGPPPEPVGYWSKLIETLARRADQFTIDDVVREIAALGKKIERKSVRARLTDLVKDGVLIRISDGVFRVSPRGVGGDELRKAGIIPPHAKLVGER
jgi:hypothetical protein